MTTKHIEIKPVTRIEGSMKVSIELDSAGNVEQAHANVLEFRGFEGFLRGRHVSRVPLITPRICGVCPVPHHLASLKAIEAGLGLELPETARLLRELLLAAAHVGDHVLHLSVLAGPDILLADLPPAERGLGPLVARFPDVVKEVLAVRTVAQTIVSALGVQGVHPTTGVPGGISRQLSEGVRVAALGEIQRAKKTILQLKDVLVPKIAEAMEACAGLGRLDTGFMGLVKGDDLELYDGVVRAIDSQGRILADFSPAEYLKFVAEKALDYSYAKRAYLRTQGPAGEMYRVGPIARVNAAKSAPTEYAAANLREFKARFPAAAQETLALNYARYITLVYAVERVEQLLSDSRITGTETLAPVKYRAGEGVGIVEAPRGLLIHHFRWDDAGYITMANIITPTNANSYAIDASLKQVAERSISGGRVDEGKLKHEVGLAVRAYDPCLSCATHAVTPGADGGDFSIEITRPEDRV